MAARDFRLIRVGKAPEMTVAQRKVGTLDMAAYLSGLSDDEFAAWLEGIPPQFHAEARMLREGVEALRAARASL